MNLREQLHLFYLYICLFDYRKLFVNNLSPSNIELTISACWRLLFPLSLSLSISLSLSFYLPLSLSLPLYVFDSMTLYNVLYVNALMLGNSVLFVLDYCCNLCGCFDVCFFVCLFSPSLLFPTVSVFFFLPLMFADINIVLVAFPPKLYSCL